MASLIADIETNGFLPELDKVHCLSLRDRDTGEIVLSCADQPGYPTIEAGLDLLAKADAHYWHYGLGFDIPAIQKVYPSWTYSGRMIDTLVIARSRFAHQKGIDFARAKAGKFPKKFIGKHSLEAWGHRLGMHKGEYTGGWEVWTPEMHSYMDQDTMVLYHLCQKIQKAGVSLAVVETEMELAAYLLQQEANGWPFDGEKAQALFTVLAVEQETSGRALREHFGSWIVSLGMFTPKVNSKKFGYTKGVPLERFKTVEFNPGSDDNIADRLQTIYGWKPKDFTDGGKPSVDEDVLLGLDYPPVKQLLIYKVAQKRLSVLAGGKKGSKGWMQLVNGEGKIHGRVDQSGAITHRATHKLIANVPTEGKPYGDEMRQLFHVPPAINGEEWSQVGVDASGLELRCLAHETSKYDNGAYAEVVLKGDPHSLTRTALGLEEFGKRGRSVSKTWKYAWLYGGGDEKLGLILSELLAPGAKSKILRELGAKSRKQYLKYVPALKYVTERLGAYAKKNGYVLLIDGRRAYCRAQHSVLNTRLQGNGAVICKRWIVEYNRRLVTEFGPQGWDRDWAALIWYHDENQLAVKTRIVEPVKNILVSSIEHMTTHFNFRCPLTGKAKAGHNWADCH